MVIAVVLGVKCCGHHNRAHRSTRNARDSEQPPTHFIGVEPMRARLLHEITKNGGYEEASAARTARGSNNDWSRTTCSRPITVIFLHPRLYCDLQRQGIDVGRMSNCGRGIDEAH